MKKIAVEEHFLTGEFIDYLYSRTECPRWEIVEDENHRKIERRWNFASDPPAGQPTVTKSGGGRPSQHSRLTDPGLYSRLADLGEGRLKDMDKAGIDVSVLSLTLPGIEEFNASDGTTWARKTNDELARAVRRYPDRFAGMAAIAPQDPSTAADELKRAVTELGFKGALINSHIQGEYLDNKKYWAIFEAAEKLEAPIYIHPRWPSPGMLSPYLAYPGLAASMWGFGAEVALHSIRLILSGVFDKYPRLKIIIGHLGEALPFWIGRVDNRYALDFHSSGERLRKKPSDYFKENFFVTTSGMYWQQPFMCTYLTLGADNILFAVDTPYESGEVAVQFMNSLPICDSDKEKIFQSNAERLLKL